MVTRIRIYKCRLMKNLEKEMLAVALKYDKDIMDAPKITASGRGELAKQILKIAKENQILIKEDKELVQILSILEVDSLIPFEVYGSVAEILSFIYQNKHKG